MCETLCITIITITSILQIHFDENQFERNRKDGRKLLRPCAVPNLLYTIEINDKEVEVEKNVKKVKDMSTNGKNIDHFRKFYIILNKCIKRHDSGIII